MDLVCRGFLPILSMECYNLLNCRVTEHVRANRFLLQLDQTHRYIGDNLTFCSSLCRSGVRGRRSGRGGRGGRRRNGCEHGQVLSCSILNASSLQRTKTKRKIRPKGKDGKPRIYPRIPKMTSLLPACISGGLHKVILEDLESHVKDYVDVSSQLFSELLGKNTDNCAVSPNHAVNLWSPQFTLASILLCVFLL